jgi:hypothetical protein
MQEGERVSFSAAEAQQIIAEVHLLKNLKGVVVYEIGEGGASGELLASFARRHRYRNVAVPQAYYKQSTEDVRHVLSRKPYVVLGRGDELEAFLGAFCELPDVHIIEPLLQASRYVVPLIMLGSVHTKFEPLALHTREVPRELSAADFKLHQRIAGYVMIDEYEKTCKESWECIFEGAGKLTALIETREKFAAEDCEKRFWRLLTEEERTNEQKKTAILYLDPLKYLAKLDLSRLARFLETHKRFVTALSLVTAIGLRAG